VPYFLGAAWPLSERRSEKMWKFAMQRMESSSKKELSSALLTRLRTADSGANKFAGGATMRYDVSGAMPLIHDGAMDMFVHPLKGRSIATRQEAGYYLQTHGM
jgi:hypothetical protein